MSISSLAQLQIFTTNKYKELSQLEQRQTDNRVNMSLLHVEEDYEYPTLLDSDEDILLSRTIEAVRNLAKALPELGSVADDLQKNFDENMKAIINHNKDVATKYSVKGVSTEIFNTVTDFPKGRLLKESRITSKSLLIKIGDKSTLKDKTTRFSILAQKALTEFDVIVHTYWENDACTVYLNDNLSDAEVAELAEAIVSKLRDTVCDVVMETLNSDTLSFIGLEHSTYAIRDSFDAHGVKCVTEMLEEVL
ncbi:hypothetical protein [Photobacterium damselae]|uniref:hypothetical protein n=1 Tax=Photobacterium damselae TaxID=38293 RepID=UPI001F216267|nr:hypothetical protein [Photobacterium damselae]UKA04770.1 hypothetical protein IHC89_21245 [Photobacterium damselae subsp. damselae]